MFNCAELLKTPSPAFKLLILLLKDALFELTDALIVFNEEVIDALNSFKPSTIAFKLVTSLLTDALNVVWLALIVLILPLTDALVELTDALNALNEEVIDALKSFKPSTIAFKSVTSVLTDEDKVVWLALIVLILPLKEELFELTDALNVLNEPDKLVTLFVNTLVSPSCCNLYSNEPLHSIKFSELLSNLASKDADNWSIVNPAIVCFPLFYNKY